MFKEIIQFNKNIKNNIAIFIHQDKNQEVKRYVLKYLEALKQLDYSIIFVTSSGIKRKSRNNLEEYVDIYINRKNSGYDFGGYFKTVDQLIKEKVNSKLSDQFLIDRRLNFNNILICNDSIFFPLFNDKLKDIKSLIDNYDIVGMTDNHELNYHFQSYFINFNKKIIKSDAFYEQWYKKYVFTDNKYENIHRNEVQMTHHFLSYGFSGKVLCSQKDLKATVEKIKIPYQQKAYNPTYHLQDVGIIYHKCPVLKKNLFVINPSQKSKIKEVIINHTDYDQELIEEVI